MTTPPAATPPPAPGLAAVLAEVMRHTPSCRYFRPDPVPPDVMHRVLDNARFASSGGNRQGWRIVVVTDPELRAGVADLHRRQWDAYIVHAREGVVGYQGDGSGKKMEHGTQYATRRLDFWPGVFGFHEVWHLFVTAASAAHFVFVLAYVVPAGLR